MTAAERKQRQRAREADRARRREPLETKLQRAQTLAEQLLANAQDVAAKLAVERKVSINARDIARYLIGLDRTDHVRAALEGKLAQREFAFDQRQKQARYIVTSQVTKQASYSVTSQVTISPPAVAMLTCFLCGNGPSAVEYMFVRDDLALCSKCAEEDNDVAEAFETIAFVMIDRFEKWVEPFKIDAEGLLEELEASLREGSVPEAEQAFAARCQQHLRAAITECDAMLRAVSITGDIS